MCSYSGQIYLLLTMTHISLDPKPGPLLPSSRSQRGFAAKRNRAVSGRALLEVRLGHNDVRTTMIYTHVLNRGGPGVKSPVDTL